MRLQISIVVLVMKFVERELVLAVIWGVLDLAFDKIFVLVIFVLIVIFIISVWALMLIIISFRTFRTH